MEWGENLPFLCGEQEEIVKAMKKWTRFMDMHSGGGTKEPPYEYIYIEASRPEAEVIFYNRFGHNPNRVSCTCCGEDYSIRDGELDQITAYNRGCRYDKSAEKWVEERDTQSSRSLLTIAKYKKQPGILFISASEIKSSERKGELPEQGYVWVE